MTKTQFNDIKEKLLEYCKDKGLSIVNQRAGYAANLSKEITEYLRANNDDDKVDALCDMIVFTLNATYKLEYRTGDSHFDNKVPVIAFAFLSMYCDKLANITDVAYFVANIIRNIEIMGYDSYKCMLETIKKISSRTGHYDEKAKNLSKILQMKPKPNGTKLIMLVAS
ncbi:hypothetical protein CPIN18021_0279 [Campylobacter pinnipediorum subsp. caledonicus]|uniref:Uncharacterized protein n=1 Tax=Campylobacter pinnipediorum subsp. caledonicus TaxID=1874362 RepID=A0A1S6U5V8_9BACT|nr:hypothetical protein [Campylobacter pinnipediorum]AQW87126.1 hypothetical protein CPIN18021_0279 [Campylobacter pinnipediorum subsp. caledonicus]